MTEAPPRPKQNQSIQVYEDRLELFFLGKKTDNELTWTPHIAQESSSCTTLGKKERYELTSYDLVIAMLLISAIKLTSAQVVWSEMIV